MKTACPYNDNLIPTSACNVESSPLWLAEIATYVGYMNNYQDNIKLGIKPYAGAFLYIQSFANIINILYQHYDTLPSIYFDLLEQAITTISTTKPDDNTDSKASILSNKQALLIYNLATINENNENHNELASKYYTKVKEKSKFAANPKISREHYLSILYQRLAKEARVAAVRKSFLNLANTFTKENKSQRVVVTLIPDKQPSSPRCYLRSRRNGSPALFKTSKKEPETVASNKPTSNQLTHGCGIL